MVAQVVGRPVVIVMFGAVIKLLHPSNMLFIADRLLTTNGATVTKLPQPWNMVAVLVKLLLFNKPGKLSKLVQFKKRLVVVKF